MSDDVFSLIAIFAIGILVLGVADAILRWLEGK